jgi:hypothetical protein
MIMRTEERLGLKPDRLAADTAYGTGKFLGWLIGKGITPHIPVWDMSAREDGTFSRADFTFDKERNVYICPEGKLLTSTGRVHDGRTILYRASTRDCGSCHLKPKCTPNMTFRKIPRDVHEDARDVARAWMGKPEFDKSRDDVAQRSLEKARSGDNSINGHVKNQRANSGDGSSVEAVETCATHRDCVAVVPAAGGGWYCTGCSESIGLQSIR